MYTLINDSLKTEHYHLVFKIKMTEGTNDCLKRFVFANGTFRRLPDGSF